MGTPSKRRALIGVGLAALSIVLVLTPVLLNVIVVRKLDMKAAREQLTMAVESQTGLALTVQGVKYRFLRGLVFHGVRIQPKDAKHGVFILQAESLMLQLSLYEALRGRMPFTRLLVSEGRINPYALSAAEWKSVLERFEKTVGVPSETQSKPGLGAAGAGQPSNQLAQIEFMGERLRLVVPETVMPGGRKRTVDKVRVDFLIQPGVHRWTADLYTGTQAGEARIQARGRWKDNSARRVNFKFSGVPLPLLYRLTARLPVWPPELRIPLERAHIESGQLAGRGSVDLTGSGVGLNFNGQYTKVTLHIGDRASYHLAVKSAEGAFRYNAAYLSFADAPAQTELEVRQEDLQLRLLQRDVKLKQGREHFLEAEVKATASHPDRTKAGIRVGVPGGKTEGKLDFFARYTYGSGWVQPDLRFALQDFRVHLTAPLYQLNAPKDDEARIPTLRVTTGSATQKPGKPLLIEANGDLEGAPWKISGQSESSFLIDPNTNEPALVLSQDLKAEVHVSRLPYRLLLVPAARIHGHVLEAGSRADSHRAEEQGLLRKYQFMDPVYERAFFSHTKADVRFTLSDMQDAGTAWPKTISMHIRKDPYVLQLTIPETTGHSSRFSFQITSRPANRPMPYHDMDGSLDVTGNHLPFPEFLGNELPPTEIHGNVRAFGQGWYAYDIITQTYSEFSLELKRVDLSGLQAAAILKHKLRMKPEDFLVDEFRLKRRTDLNRFSYYPVEVKTKRLNLRASGQFVPQQGGDLSMQYEWQTGKMVDGKPETISDRLDLLISAEGQWSPSSAL